MLSEKVTIKLPKPLYDKLKKVIEGTGYGSVTEFVVFVLRDLLASKDIEESPQLTEKEIAAIRRRLKNLGYLD